MEGIKLIGCSCCHHEGCGWGRALAFVICSRFLLLEMCHVGTSSGRTFWMQQMVWYLRNFHLWVHAVWLESISWFLKYHWGCRGIHILFQQQQVCGSTHHHSLCSCCDFLGHKMKPYQHDNFGRCFNVNHVLFIWWISLWSLVVFIFELDIPVWLGTQKSSILDPWSDHLLYPLKWGIISWTVILILVSLINAVLQACWAKHNRCSSKDCFWCGTDPYCNSMNHEGGQGMMMMICWYHWCPENTVSSTSFPLICGVNLNHSNLLEMF